MKKKSFAFTLAEVLIAMTIIGAVSALVMPQLILGQKSNKARAQFNTAYSILTQAVTDMDADSVSVKQSSYEESSDFLAVLKNYVKVTQDCGTTLCEPKPSYPSSLRNQRAFILNNGMLFIAEKAPKQIVIRPSNLGYNEYTEKIAENDLNKNSWISYFIPEAKAAIIPLQPNYRERTGVILVTVDVNGNSKPPNKRGYDVFSFQLVDGDIVPVGGPGTFAQLTNCSRSSNGMNLDFADSQMACSNEAAIDENYFKTVYREL
ncbi:type II secretion system protein [bacterium]|nr:type II secretion system protein [bacterium]